MIPRYKAFRLNQIKSNYFILYLIFSISINGALGFDVRGPICRSPFSSTHCRTLPFYSKGESDKYSNYNDESYWGDIDDEEDDLDGRRNFGYEDRYESDQDYLDWEVCEDGSTMVLLPPPSVKIPSGIIHFVGGTVFGSSPKLWYGSLLEEIVRGTDCAVVATSIPVTVTKNPLQHVKLSRNLQHKFQNAYADVLEDEYGDDIGQVPIVALGHSLGARLLTVLATLEPSKNSITSKYKSYILLSFTNYGAASSIPGVDQLVKSRQEIDMEPDRRRQRRRRRRSRVSPRERYEEWDDYYGYYDDDVFGEEIEEFVGDLKESVIEKAEIFRDTLTPKTNQLEFFPSPNQLWDALSRDDRYSISETLLIHFESDDVDQSARLATCLSNSTDLKYAFLRGTHLSPISVNSKDESWMELPSKATKALWDIVSGQKSSLETSKAETKNMENLRRTIISYLTDVATVK